MDDKRILALDVYSIFSNEIMNEIYDEEDRLERERLKTVYLLRAKELGVRPAAKKLIKSFDEAEKQIDSRYKRQQRANKSVLPLKFDGNGQPAKTIENFILILRMDDHFKDLRFNLLSSTMVIKARQGVKPWSDEDDARAREYIEKKYFLYHPQKLEDALRIVALERAYHPIKDIIESVIWDGVDRIPTFLSKWMKCDDTPYTREVSRLIFAGGIHRLYRPGCKFDDVPVLIGTKQGEGKSSFVRWLALRDEFFAEVTEIEGQKGIESIEGIWICEIAELLALTKAKEVEAVKSYITKQSDKYRKPFERRVSEVPRQCIFIGTTNNVQFLTDKTGNRRFYPVECHSDGYDLFNHKEECQADILQCWRQAKVMFDAGTLEPMADPKLKREIRQRQSDAVEDDWREGVIKEYLEDKSVTCVLEIWEQAFGYQFQKPSKKESKEIALIMQAMEGWVKAEKVKRQGRYGPQRVWVKDNVEQILLSDEGDLPFG